MVIKVVLRSHNRGFKTIKNLVLVYNHNSQKYGKTSNWS